MPEPPHPREDPGAADMRVLVQLGREESPPVPAPATNPFLEPQYPDGAWTDGTDPA
ncbi:hypothetical protein [Streptomyces cyanogenus]|uniref:Uncharacterized protein n=1 Tax=Streptomyces cyanogenus TaxID=80860 RepID=A0ABX7TK44_STRCY|nr:hypothetical protein [Streptomyces cyanogenus]QTD96952.1 hypothetical protein S1361_06285 [Streptomyces cyanogenus]